MTRKLFCTAVICLLANLPAYAQKETAISIALLSDDKTANVNIADSDSFIKALNPAIDLMTGQFANIPETQKVGLLLTFHNSGKPAITLYATPKLEAQLEAKFLKDLNAVAFPNTRFIDYSMLLMVNVNKDYEAAFKDFVNPEDQKIADYNNAGLQQKYELNKKWAAEEVLPILSAYQTIVDGKFAGVKNFGTLVAKTDFTKQQDIAQMTSNNYDYWRACMEMESGNELIPITKIFMLVSQGQIDYAMKLLEMVDFFSKAGVAEDYLQMLQKRLRTMNSLVETELQKGIQQHDKGNYKAAIAIYDGILAQYPNSAWTLYEHYFSQNALDAEAGKSELGEQKNWETDKVNIYKANPLYNMDVRASNGKQGYLLFRRNMMTTLFKEKDRKIADVYEYADIAYDLGVYDFAAQMYWYAFTYDKNAESVIFKHLYALEKLGVTKLKTNFKGNFEKEFKKIDAGKEKEMKSNTVYKSFDK